MLSAVAPAAIIHFVPTENNQDWATSYSATGAQNKTVSKPAARKCESYSDLELFTKLTDPASDEPPDWVPKTPPEAALSVLVIVASGQLATACTQSGLAETEWNLDVPIQVTITLGTAAGIGLAFLMLRRVHPDLAELLFARGMTGIFVKLSIVFGVMSGLGLSAVILQSIVSIKAHLGLDDKLPGRTFEGVRAGFK
ncbi:unnamed protein product [Polarella glacialis]|uniref:Uncharacterized protein n=1 Tax=Polarella glacialis TaxID=89957 RepID=A0A813JFJ5_POLGL|nr:unnamed protein product [Polarella glacialis]